MFYWEQKWPNCTLCERDASACLVLPPMRIYKAKFFIAWNKFDANALKWGRFNAIFVFRRVVLSKMMFNFNEYLFLNVDLWSVGQGERLASNNTVGWFWTKKFTFCIIIGYDQRKWMNYMFGNFFLRIWLNPKFVHCAITSVRIT